MKIEFSLSNLVVAVSVTIVILKIGRNGNVTDIVPKGGSISQSTVIFKIFLGIIKMALHAKNEDAMSRHLEVIMLTNGNTQKPMKTLPTSLSLSVVI